MVRDHTTWLPYRHDWVGDVTHGANNDYPEALRTACSLLLH